MIHIKAIDKFFKKIHHSVPVTLKKIKIIGRDDIEFTKRDPKHWKQ